MFFDNVIVQASVDKLCAEYYLPVIQQVSTILLDRLPPDPDICINFRPPLLRYGSFRLFVLVRRLFACVVHVHWLNGVAFSRNALQRTNLGALTPKIVKKFVWVLPHRERQMANGVQTIVKHGYFSDTTFGHAFSGLHFPF